MDENGFQRQCRSSMLVVSLVLAHFEVCLGFVILAGLILNHIALFVGSLLPDTDVVVSPAEQKNHGNQVDGDIEFVHGASVGCVPESQERLVM